MIKKPIIPRFVSRGPPVWFCGFLVLCASAAIAADQEPSYKGRLLSQWVGDMPLNEPMTGHQPYLDAVRAIGTNAIPTLLKWISYERPLSQQSEDGPATSVLIYPVRDRPPNPAELAVRSPHAFEVLGAIARPALPELTRLARTSSDPERAGRCAISLSYIGREAIPSLLSLVTNSPPWTRWYAIEMLEHFASDPMAAPLVPLVISCLDDTNTYYPIDSPAGSLFERIGPAVAVPALTNALQSPSIRTRRRAASFLWELQFTEATNVPPSAEPALRKAMLDPDVEVRNVASNVLRRINGWESIKRYGTNTLHGFIPDFLTNAPSSNQHLQPTPR